jgi:hypothetical protein
MPAVRAIDLTTCGTAGATLVVHRRRVCSEVGQILPIEDTVDAGTSVDLQGDQIRTDSVAKATSTGS